MQEVKKLSQEIGCGLKLARDLLTLAGGDYDLVVSTSKAAVDGVETLKTNIIDSRLSALEVRMAEIEEEYEYED